MLNNPDIVKNWDGHEAIIKQDVVIREIELKLIKCNRQQIFDNNWLDIEPLFRKEGWSVFYDKPGYNETYTAFWNFSKRK